MKFVCFCDPVCVFENDYIKDGSSDNFVTLVARDKNCRCMVEVPDIIVDSFQLDLLTFHTQRECQFQCSTQPVSLVEFLPRDAGSLPHHRVYELTFRVYALSSQNGKNAFSLKITCYQKQQLPGTGDSSKMIKIGSSVVSPPFLVMAHVYLGKHHKSKTCLEYFERLRRKQNQSQFALQPAVHSLFFQYFSAAMTELLRLSPLDKIVALDELSRDLSPEQKAAFQQLLTLSLRMPQLQSLVPQAGHFTPLSSLQPDSTTPDTTPDTTPAPPPLDPPLDTSLDVDFFVTELPHFIDSIDLINQEAGYLHLPPF